MKKTAYALISVLLAGIFTLLLLSGLGIFPKYETIAVCPVDAISMQGQKAVIDADKCIGCQRCVLGIKVPVQGSVAEQTLDPSTSTPVPQDTLRVAEAVSPAKEPLPTKVVKDLKEPKAATPVVKAKPTVIPDKCIGCRLCAVNCPVDAIRMVDGKAIIDRDKCIDCGICIVGNNDDFAGCPVNAIEKP